MTMRGNEFAEGGFLTGGEGGEGDRIATEVEVDFVVSNECNKAVNMGGSRGTNNQHVEGLILHQRIVPTEGTDAEVLKPDDGGSKWSPVRVGDKVRFEEGKKGEGGKLVDAEGGSDRLTGGGRVAKDVRREANEKAIGTFRNGIAWGREEEQVGCQREVGRENLRGLLGGGGGDREGSGAMEVAALKSKGGSKLEESGEVNRMGGVLIGADLHKIVEHLGLAVGSRLYFVEFTATGGLTPEFVRRHAVVAFQSGIDGGEDVSGIKGGNGRGGRVVGDRNLRGHNARARKINRKRSERKRRRGWGRNGCSRRHGVGEEEKEGQEQKQESKSINRESGRQERQGRGNQRGRSWRRGIWRGAEDAPGRERKHNKNIRDWISERAKDTSRGRAGAGGVVDGEREDRRQDQ